MTDGELDRIIRGVIDGLRELAPRAFYTPPQIAKLLGIEAEKVLGWIRRGELAGVNVVDRTGGRARWRVSSDALDDFLKRRQAAKPAAVSRRRKNQPADFIEFV
jgi:excisionase family DNA binding protein